MTNKSNSARQGAIDFLDAARQRRDIQAKLVSELPAYSEELQKSQKLLSEMDISVMLADLYKTHLGPIEPDR